MTDFNFTTGGNVSSNQINFPLTGQVEGLPDNFNFSESGYVASSNFNFGSDIQRVFSLLAGTSNNFIAIWADSSASLTNGKMYVSSSGAFSIVNLDDDVLYDCYTISRKGRGNELLESDTVLDISIA